MYLMNCLAARGRELDALRAMRAARGPAEARQAIADELPERVAAILNPDELEPLHQRLRALPEPPARPHLIGDDWLGAAAFSVSSFSRHSRWFSPSFSFPKRRSQ
jgi:hypothetical protein